MASQWPPKKGAAFDLYFSLYKTDGTVIANPGTYTRTVGKDGGASDTTPDNAVTEIDTTYGRLKWTLSADEMNADVVEVMCRDDTSGCIPFTQVIHTAAYTLDEIAAMVDDLESRLTADRAGYLDNLSAGAVATAATLATVAGYLDTEIAAILEDTSELQTDLTNGGRLDLLIDAIKAKTDNLPASPAAVGSEMDLVDAPNADALAAAAVAFLDCLLGAGDADAINARTVRSALRALRNMTDLVTTPGTMIVCKEDDNSADPAWTAAVSTDASAEPITVVDPA